MIRFALVVGLLVLCGYCPAAAAGLEIYELMGLSPGHVGSDGEAFGNATAAAAGELVGGTWSADEKPRIGFFGGVGVRYPVTDLVSVAAEWDFAVRGSRWDLDEATSGLTLTQTLALNYWEIPLLAQLRPRVGGSIQPSFLAGPYLGLLAHSEVSIGVPPDPSLETLVTLDLQDVAKSSYVGGVIGAGAEFQTAEKSSLLLQVRYTAAFANVMKDEIGYEFKPQGFAFLLGLSYKL
jgi:opacity protein-like surface antigen